MDFFLNTVVSLLVLACCVNAGLPPGIPCSANSQCTSKKCVFGVCECTPGCSKTAVKSCTAGCSYSYTKPPTATSTFCFAASPQYPKACNRRRLVGQACFADAECDITIARCRGGYCLILDGMLGCKANSDCASGSCVANTCACTSVFGFGLCPDGYYCNTLSASPTRPAACSLPLDASQIGIPGATCSSASTCLSGSCKLGRCECNPLSTVAISTNNTAQLISIGSGLGGCFSPQVCLVTGVTPAYCSDPLKPGSACVADTQCGGYMFTPSGVQTVTNCIGGKCLVKAGLNCQVNTDCASGSCYKAGAMTAGQCQCADTGLGTCNVGTICLPAGLPAGPRLCAGSSLLGAPCKAGADCVTGICTSPSFGAPGTCTKKQIGQGCSTNSDCETSNCHGGVCQCTTACDNSLTCNSASKCGGSSGCKSAADGNNFCAAGPPGTSCTDASQCASGICTKGAGNPLAPGLCSCVPSVTCPFSPNCLGGCPADQGACKLTTNPANPNVNIYLCGTPQLNGAPCANAAACVSGICTNNVCVGRPLYALCTSDAQCQLQFHNYAATLRQPLCVPVPGSATLKYCHC